MCDDSITVSMPSIPASHEMYSSQRFESEPKMGHVTYICELNHVHKVDDMDEKDESHKEVQENQEDEEDQEEDEEDQEEDEEDQEEDEEDQEEDEEDQEEDEEDQEEDEEDQEDQEDQEDKEDQEDQKEQEYQLSLHITSYIKRREEEMMKKFQEQLNEKTQILQAEIKNQRSSLETLKDKLREMRNSKSQALPSTTGHVHSPDLLEPAPKKPRFEAMKSPFSNISETTSVSGSCLPYSSQFTKELQQTFDTSSQVPIKEVKQQHQEQQQQQKQQEQQPQQKQQEQQPQQQEQQQQEQMGAEQQPPGYYRADNLNASGYYPAESLIGRENGRLRFFPENQHQPRMNLFSMAHGPGSHTMYSTNLPQTTTITHNPQLVTLETPQDYVRLWQRPQGPQSHFYQVVQLSNWTPNEQTTLGQAASAQVAPTEQVQHSSGPGTVQASGNYGPYQLNSYCGGARYIPSEPQLHPEIAMAVPRVCAKLPQEVLAALQLVPQMEATPGMTGDKAFLSITLPPGPTGHIHTVHNNQLIFPPRFLSEGD
ncbi:circadian clock protein PASD1 [Moschus berezovskii]|uniref:circadian clock protein PASD1 n=1 Tax=Moschus berezovskii TaxID=68408 RepID=UPI002443AE62|nr:circadian clock protein PASD1 [Moschus berezovskii]